MKAQQFKVTTSPPHYWNIGGHVLKCVECLIAMSRPANYSITWWYIIINYYTRSNLVHNLNTWRIHTLCLQLSCYTMHCLPTWQLLYASEFERIFSRSLSLDYQMPQSAEVIDFIIAHTHTHTLSWCNGNDYRHIGGLDRHFDTCLLLYALYIWD